MLIGLRILQHGGGMDAGLGDEGALADIRRVPVRRAVKPLVERMRDMSELFKCRLGNPDVETFGKFRLELERRNDGNKIGVAAALAEPVERALNLACTSPHSSKGIGHP